MKLVLVSLIARYIATTLHELPAGVLYALNGATIEECKELELLLMDFCQFAARYEVEANYLQLIQDARYHYRAYFNYLESGTTESYQLYLEREKQKN